ncbi:MAG TPA: hypothetical protein VLM42_16295 [Bryobacteraceae bacterium]|nr:hypothetical protein [Bryobacteraceae bacterium]
MKPNILVTTFAALTTVALAQTPVLQMGAMYQCAPTQVLKLFSCNADTCDVQIYAGGQPAQRLQPNRQKLTALLAPCHVQTPQEAQTAARAASQGDPNGFKIGDTVQINTAFGWIEGRILAINGNDYRVHAQSGVDVTKTYPAELHRTGPLNDHDHASGLYDLHDRVQVNFEGRWIDSEVLTILGMEYQVKLPGNRAVWAKPENLRYVGAPLKPAAPAAGTPPKPGLVSCAGKFEGRYSNTSGFGNMTIIFRSGKATLADPTGSGGEVMECWTGGGKIYLHKPGDPASEDMPLDINNDGTLDTPFGEIKKKGN